MRPEDVFEELETARAFLRTPTPGDARDLFRYVRWASGHARAELAYVLSREYWGRGLMAEAVRAVIRFGFEKMDLNRIEARCISENSASARVLEKAGMTFQAARVHQGRLPGHEGLLGAAA